MSERVERIHLPDPPGSALPGDGVVAHWHVAQRAGPRVRGGIVVLPIQGGDYGDQGFMYLTLLSEDLEGEVPDQDELNLWADSIGITAPVLQDDAGVAATVVGDDGFPRLQVLDRDMTLAVDQVNPPTDAQLRAEIEALL